MSRKRSLALIVLLSVLALVFALNAGCGDDDDDDGGCPPISDDDDDTSDDDVVDDDDSDDDDVIDDDDTDDDDTVDDDDSFEYCEDYDDALASGRSYLQVGIPEMARPAFECVVHEDAEISDGHYGLMLSGSLHLYEIVSLLSVMIADFESGHQQKDIDEDREFLRQIISMIADGYFHPAGENVRVSYDWLTEAGNPSMTIDDVPILWELKPVASLGSEFDAGEKELCLVVGDVFDGLGGHLISLKIDINLLYVFDLNFSGTTEEIITGIVYMLDDMLNDPAYPDSFKIDPDYEERLSDSRMYLGVGFLGVRKALDAIMSETDDQSDDVFGYIDENSNNAYDEGEPLWIPGIGEIEGDDLDLVFAVADLLYDLGAAFLDRTPLDVNPEQDDPFHLSAANDLLRAFGIPGIIPNFLTVDIAKVYEDLEEDSIRNLLQTVVNMLKLILPAPAAA